jgi:hypothetical protein
VYEVAPGFRLGPRGFQLALRVTTYDPTSIRGIDMGYQYGISTWNIGYQPDVHMGSTWNLVHRYGPPQY